MSEVNEYVAIKLAAELQRALAERDALQQEKDEALQIATETLAQMMIRKSLATGHGDTVADLVRELEPEVERLSINSARYLYLRDQLWSQALSPKIYTLPIVWGVDLPEDAGKSLDAAIDAAMKEKK